ncbi:MAG: tetratricopeptide repeat protein [Bacteroidetes bacterium]|nr:tetratricopeptide repeat protein [Bacteroidota bacterium]
MIKAEETALGLKSGNLGLQLAKKLNYKSGQIKMYYSLGILYHNLENYTKARELFFNGLELTVSLNKKRAIAAMNENIGLTYKDEGNYTEAVKYQLNALKVYEETADSSRIAKTYMNLGNLFSNQDKTDEALNYYSLAEVYYAKKQLWRNGLCSFQQRNAIQ